MTVPINLDAFYRKADRLVSAAERSDGPHSRAARVAIHAAEQAFVRHNPAFVQGMARMKRLPVTIQEFMDGSDFLGGVEYDIWPALKQDVFSMNPDVMSGEEPVHEILLGGATGTGKTYTSTATIMYQTYLLTCFDKPQRLFGLAPSTPIVFFLQSVSAAVTKRVIYQPLRDTLTAMKYFQRFAPHNKYVDSELQIDGGIKIIPALASLQSILGQAVCGALLDEVNFMTIVEQSKKAAGPGGMGGKFDQAEEVYSNISRRRKRSFTTRGISIGCICMASSTRYKDDMLDRRIDQSIAIKETNIRVFRHAQYDVNPKYTEEGGYDTFEVAVGNAEQGTKVIEAGMVAGVHYPATAIIKRIPMPYLTEFRKNPDAALRDVVGIATDAITPFIRKRHKITEAIQRGTERGLIKMVEKDLVVLADDGMPTLIHSNLDTMPAAQKRKPRWIHVDLSRVDDRCGIGMVRLDGFVNAPMKDLPGMSESLPRFTVELAVGIKPSAVAEIDIADVRGWIMQFIAFYGLNVEGITFDGFDSRETIQALRKANIRSDTLSVDTSTLPYEQLRDALYEDRLDIQPDAELFAQELRTIEYYPEKRKVDHPPRGTKDVADGVAGAIANAMKSRLVRNGMLLSGQAERDDETDQPANSGQPANFQPSMSQPANSVALTRTSQPANSEIPTRTRGADPASQPANSGALTREAGRADPPQRFRVRRDRVRVEPDRDRR